MNLYTVEFAEQLLSGNENEAWSTVLKHVDLGRNSLFIYEKLFSDAMRYVGSLWEQNYIGVADEHLASGVCDAVLTRYTGMVPRIESIGRKAMFLCLEGEEHYLGLKLVSSLFKEKGWSVKCFGPNLPLEYAVNSAVNWKPDVIGLSVSIVHRLPTLCDYVETLEGLQHAPSILVGGRVAGQYPQARYGGERTLYLSNLLEVEEWLHAKSSAVKLYKSNRRTSG